MKINRSQNASRNIIVGGLLKLYQILVPFVMRTLMIYFMGVQYLGLNSLFTSVLSVLNLAELGVGSAMVYSMYKPIAEDDKVTICALMNLYKIYYRIIGIIIGVAGLVITPFVPKLIKGTVPDGISVYALYLLNLGATVLSYWMFAYKNSLLSAHQRTDVASKVAMLTSTVQYILQAFVLCFLKNYYMYVICVLICQVTYNIIIAIITTRMYPEYDAKGSISSEEKAVINQRIKDLFTSRLGMVILNSGDTLVISGYMGLISLAVYQNYFFIVSSVTGFITVIFGSVTAGIGNSIVTETEEKNYNDLVKFTFMISWLCTFCVCCFLCMFQPFMRLWVGADLLLPFSIVICLCIYFYMWQINQLINVFKDAAGMWHEDRFRPMTTAFTNLIANLILVQFWGLYGIVFSTIISWIIVGWPWLFHNLFNYLFDHAHLKHYLTKLVTFTAVAVVVSAITARIGHFINYNDVTTLILRFLLCLVLPNVMMLLIYLRSKELRESILLVDKMTKGKLKLNRIFAKVLD